MNTYDIEMTDTFNGEANYSWVKKGSITIPDLLHYGYDGSNGYITANKKQEAQIIRRAKAALGITGRHIKESYGDNITLRFPSACVIVFITFRD